MRLPIVLIIAATSSQIFASSISTRSCSYEELLESLEQIAHQAFASATISETNWYNESRKVIDTLDPNCSYMFFFRFPKEQQPRALELLKLIIMLKIKQEYQLFVQRKPDLTFAFKALLDWIIKIATNYRERADDLVVAFYKQMHAHVEDILQSIYMVRVPMIYEYFLLPVTEFYEFCLGKLPHIFG